MKPLFAPWRMEVIEEYKKAQSCILCRLKASQNDAEDLIIHRSDHSFVVMNKYPYTNGHMMFVPNRHLSDWTSLEESEFLEMQKLSQKAIRILEQKFNAQAYNLGVNLGRAAGAGIHEHLHMHLVPRWEGDFNFMPLFSEVKVISEHLAASYQKIKEAWGD